MPVAIITGDMDAIVDARGHSCRLHQQVSESTLTILPGQGHMIHYFARPQIGRAVDGLMGLPRTKPKRAAVVDDGVSGRSRLFTERSWWGEA